MCRRSFMAHNGAGGMVCSGSSSSRAVDTSWPTRGSAFMASPDSVMMSPGLGGSDEAATACPYSWACSLSCPSPWPVISALPDPLSLLGSILDPTGWDSHEIVNFLGPEKRGGAMFGRQKHPDD